jgi:acetoin utilization deacetylase AcuC-like enzyme
MPQPLIITGDMFGRHDCKGHPESQYRLEQALRGVPLGIERDEPIPADIKDLSRVHDPLYLRDIERISTFCPETRCCYLDSDTYITHHSYEVARFAAGSAIEASVRAMKGEPCFALIRPPGHHAGRSSAMGFCLFNNAAVAAAAALERVNRVAIVDWDVHHGNGTQDIFYTSNRVLYCSVHQSSLFPGTGYPDEIGAGEGSGFTLNAPLPPGSGIDTYRQVFMSTFVPAVVSFDPSLLIISAGQDCLWDDPLGRMDLRPEDLGEITRIILGTGIPVSFVLEGGYGPSHAAAIRAVFDALMSDLC